MKHGFARIAAASIRVYLGDVAKNEKELLEAMRRLQAQGVEAAVFPELCLTGYTLGDLLLHPSLQQSALEALLRLAEKAGSMAAVVGLPLTVEGRLYNCAAVIQGGRIRGIVPKIYLTDGGGFEESRWFVSGAGAQGSAALQDMEIPFAPALLFDMGSFTLAVEICEDLWAPVPPSSRYGAADIILNPSASNALAGKHATFREMPARHSARLQAGYACANAGFGESTSDLVFCGYTGIFEDGRVLAEGSRFSMEGCEIIADIDVQRLRYRRQRNREYFQRTAGQEARMLRVPMEPREKKLPLPLRRKPNPLPFVPEGDQKESQLREIADIQTMGLVSRLEAIHCRDLVIGVSGGLDSTLALFIAVKAFDILGTPRSGIHGISMPGMGTGKRTRTNGSALMEALKVSMREIPIKEAVLQHFQDIGHDPETYDVTYENSQARERTQILMDIANQCSGIVLGTGDMSELALGFCTYNGDHMSMYNVNCSVTKTLAKALVRYLAERDFEEPIRRICADIADTPISPELLPVAKDAESSQRTEEILGDYALHDFFLYHMLDGGSGSARLQWLAEQAFEGVYPAEKIQAQLSVFIRRFFTQQFKRNCSPDGPMVGSIGLSPRGGLRMPGDMGAGILQRLL